MWCSVCVPSVRAGGVLFKTRTQYQRVLGTFLAKCPNAVWVLHREKVVLGVVLSCYVVLGSRVVLSHILLCYVVLSPVVLCCIEVYVCCIVLCCVVLRCMVWCFVCVPSFRAGEYWELP